MNLLLLLSALLSALTGIGGSARQPQLAQAVAQEKVARPAATVRAVLLARPLQSVATLASAAIAPVSRAWSLLAAEPAFAGRRRE
ncbi:hypothetical protein KZ810_02565 [Sphingomonas sp. RHCKR47]|uniref:hypothetical protein n=1 Tax=Sphingomonas citricola TaxID=2862498 RepID=UPI001CA58894|nr:hypothetical protein [Sphingomonas citricola]MBW6522370.1 hypothetical protein [Sphingomonas citricola]